MLSNEAAEFDFSEYAPEDVPNQSRPNLVLLYDTRVQAFVESATLDTVDPLGLDSHAPEEQLPPKKALHTESGGVLDAYKLYSLRLDQFPRLDPELQERLLHRLALNDEEARRQIYLGNQRLVIALSKTYNVQQLEQMDLIQAGMIGLDEATEKFSIFRSKNFSAFARYLIRDAMHEAIENARGLSTKDIWIIGQVRQAEDWLTQEYGRFPSASEISAETKFSQKTVERALLLAKGNIYLNAPLAEDFTGYDFLPSEETSTEDMVEETEIQEMLAALIKKHLSEREAFVINQSFGFTEGENTMTYREMAAVLGVNQSRIGQIKEAALGKLKAPLAELRAGADDI